MSHSLRFFVGRFVALAPLLAAAACASTPAAPAPVPRAAPVADAKPSSSTPELDAARAVRARYEARTPPRYTGRATKEDRARFAATLKAWVVEEMPRWDEVLTAYRRAWSTAPAPEAKLAVIRETLDIAHGAATRFIAAGESATPDEWRRDPTIGRILHEALAEASDNLWILPVMRACMPVSDATAARCIQEGQALLAATPTPPSAPSAPKMGSGAGTYAVPAHTWIATQADACIFSGSVRLEAEMLYADRAATVPIATTRFEVDAERLKPPTTPGGPYEVALTWPAHGTVWVRGSARVFELPERMAAVPSHVWIDKGTAVPGRIAGTRLLLTPPAADCGGCRKLLSPSVAPRVEASCDKVLLTGSSRPAPVAGEAAWRTLADQPIALAERPNGPPIATISGGSTVMLLETSGESAHVRGSDDPWSIEGWVRTIDFGPEPPMGVIAVIAQYEGDPHRVRADAPVTLGARRAKTPLTLPAGALVFVTKREGPACAVIVPHIEPINGDSALTVECDRLEAAAAVSR